MLISHFKISFKIFPNKKIYDAFFFFEKKLLLNFKNKKLKQVIKHDFKIFFNFECKIGNTKVQPNIP